MTSVSADGATTTLYLREQSGTYQQSTDQVSWTSLTFPLTLTNINATPASNVLKVYFASNLTITSTDGYIVMNSDGIQLGNATRNANGTRPTITIDVDDYPGFVRNGTGAANGYSNVSVYNLSVDGTGHTLIDGAGWIGQRYYGKAGTSNVLVNCSSYGPISSFGGGLVGWEAGSGVPGTAGALTLRGCSSYGAMAIYAGGIAGHYAGYFGGSVTCEECWSEGTIGEEAGGIFGTYGGQGGSATATRCYSIGSIGTNAGGIYGANAGESAGSASAQGCYSRGSIGTGGGGIYGSNAAPDTGVTVASNCYSSGSIGSGGAGGIYGTGASGNATTTSCYSANGSWNSATAQSTLNMNVYISITTNQPYELRAFGPSPYSLTTVVSDDVTVSATRSVVAGTPSTGGVLSEVSSYSLLEINGVAVGGTPSITVNSTTGAITASNAGTYTLLIRAETTSYSITTVVLTVTVVPLPSRVSARGKGYDFETYIASQAGNVLVRERKEETNLRFESFEEYTKYLKSRSTLT